MNQALRMLMRALTTAGENLDVEQSRLIADMKKLDPVRILAKTLDQKIYHDDYPVPVRIYFPSQEAMDAQMKAGHPYAVLVFFHGGGWVTESVETYDRVCAQMAYSTGQLVVSVEYRLAPEYKFPIGLEDCYVVTRELFRNHFILNVDSQRITLMGDSAGGNLTAAVCLLARDRGEFMPAQQILIYPAVGFDYSADSPYASVLENGEDYLLSAQQVEDYMALYQSKPEDRKSPYFAPIRAENLQNMPRTLVITAQYDPLRDEGEDYARRLKEAGNDVQVYRIAEAVHGFFALGVRHLYVQESFDIINEFLRRT